LQYAPTKQQNFSGIFIIYFIKNNTLRALRLRWDELLHGLYF